MNYLINKILKAVTPEELFTRSNFKKEYHDYMKLLHPDICNLPGSSEAVKILNGYKSMMEGNTKGEDESGKYQLVNDKTIYFTGNKDLLQKSMNSYHKLMKLNDEASIHFRRYLPVEMKFQGDMLALTCNERVISLKNLKLPGEHVSWILSRIFEFVSWLHQSGYCHAGIHPESIYVVPETHGIVCVSFYHLTSMHTRLDTVSAKYFNWYPYGTFTDMTAIPVIDLELAQRTAIYLLGDQSGIGIKLKKTENEQLIDFLITSHYDSYKTYDEYRQLLKSIFGKPKFHELKI